MFVLVFCFGFCFLFFVAVVCFVVAVGLVVFVCFSFFLNLVYYKYYVSRCERGIHNSLFLATNGKKSYF